MATVYYDGALLTFKQEAFHRFVPFSFFSFNLRSHYFPLVIAVFARLDVFFLFFFFFWKYLERSFSSSVKGLRLIEFETIAYRRRCD